MVKGVIEALAPLAKTIGPEWLLIYLIILIGAWMGWRVYQDRRKDRVSNALVVEKERAVQRSSEEARQMKKAFYVEHLGWSDEKFARIFVTNEFTEADERKPIAPDTPLILLSGPDTNPNPLKTPKARKAKAGRKATKRKAK